MVSAEITQLSSFISINKKRLFVLPNKTSVTLREVCCERNRAVSLSKDAAFGFSFQCVAEHIIFHLSLQI